MLGVQKARKSFTHGHMEDWSYYEAIPEWVWLISLLKELPDTAADGSGVDHARSVVMIAQKKTASDTLLSCKDYRARWNHLRMGVMVGQVSNVPVISGESVFDKTSIAKAYRCHGSNKFRNHAQMCMFLFPYSQPISTHRLPC